jgi:hypothetical protein
MPDDVHLATPVATLTALAFEPANGDRALLAAWDGVRPFRLGRPSRPRASSV